MRTYLEHLTGKLSAPTWALVQEILSEAELGKGDYFLEAGRVCRSIWFLEEGAVRFYELQEGNEQTTHFFLAPAFFTDYHSLLSGESSSLHMKAEEPCKVQVLPYESLAALYDQHHAIEHIGRVMAELQFMAEFNRRKSHLYLDALQRYEQLEEQQPEVFQRFQLKDIATYLGITPVSLSRLRKYRMGLGK